MKRRTVVIFSLVSALLSLVYVIMTYYGISRYLSVRMFSTESYSKNYSKLDKASDKNRVVVSLTTTPNSNLKPTINSLLDQTVRVDEISLNIPYGQKVSEEYKNILQTYNHSVNYNDTAKLICTLMREGDEDTCIILVNDNMVYGKDLIEDMVTESEKNPDVAITAKDLTSKYGVLVKPKFFDTKVIEYNTNFTHDDWLKRNLKVPHKSINYKETY